VAWTFYVNWKSRNLPKGPIKLPIIGNLHQVFGKNCVGVLHKLFTEYQKTYGKVFSFQLGSYPAVVLNDAKLIKEAWNNPMVTGRPHFILASERCRDGVNRGIVFQDGNEWTEQRRFALRHLRDFGFGKNSMESLVMDEVIEFLGELKADSGKAISTRNRFNLAVINALWTITAGQRFKHDDPQLVTIMEAITRSVGESGSCGIVFFMPWILKIWPTYPPWLRFKADLPHSYNFMQAFTGKSLANFDGSEINNFTDAYIDEIKKTTDPKSSFYGKRGGTVVNS
ncbi:unnamed protein product, partial [Allacma fusca]